MKKRTKILLIVLAAAAAVLAALVIWQWDNITALRYSRTYTSEEMQTMSEENTEAIGTALEKVPEVSARPLTEEEKAGLRDGSLTEEDAAKLILGEAADTPDAEESTAQPQEAPQSAADSQQEELDGLIAQIYVLEAEYSNKLEDMKQAAIDEYAALDQSEQTSANKYKIGLKYMNEALALEKTCDAQMEELESGIYDILKATGGDTSFVDDIKRIYAEEKAVKKAQYLSQF